MLMIKSFPAPFFRKTATGGNKIAIIIRSSLLSILVLLFISYDGYSSISLCKDIYSDYYFKVRNQV